MGFMDVVFKVFSTVMSIAGEQQSKMYTAESKMTDKTDEQLKNVITSKGGSYSSIEKQAAMNEYKARNNK